MKILRPDLIFSYWIYVWYILFVFHYTEYSPKFALLIGVIDNIIMLILMLRYGTKTKTIILFILVNTLIKIVPLYYLRNNVLKWKDIMATLFLFVLFILWLHWNSQSLVGNIKLIHDSLLYNQDKTPIMALTKKIERNVKNLRLF